MHLGIKGLITTAILATSLASNLFAADNGQDIYCAGLKTAHGPVNTRI